MWRSKKLFDRNIITLIDLFILTELLTFSNIQDFQTEQLDIGRILFHLLGEALL
jgi:hypothetical protein